MIRLEMVTVEELFLGEDTDHLFYLSLRGSFI